MDMLVLHIIIYFIAELRSTSKPSLQWNNQELKTYQPVFTKRIYKQYVTLMQKGTTVSLTLKPLCTLLQKTLIKPWILSSQCLHLFWLISYFWIVTGKIINWKLIKWEFFIHLDLCWVLICFMKNNLFFHLNFLNIISISIAEFLSDLDKAGKHVSLCTGSRRDRLDLLTQN